MKTLEEDLLNSNQRHYINYKDPSGETDREISFCVEDYFKYKKALEIIKEKQIDMHNLLNSKTCEEYNGFVHWLGCKGNLTQEEFNLLEEVLS